MRLFKKLNALNKAYHNAFNGLIPLLPWEAFGQAIIIGIIWLVCSIPELAEYWPILPIALSGVSFLYSVIAFGMLHQRRQAYKPHRGRAMLTQEAARKKARQVRHQSDRGVLWGKIRIPSDDADKHFLVVGGIGSGKTLTIKMLMKDQLPLITPGSGRRALVYDCQEDFIQYLPVTAGVGCPMYNLNPFDERRTAWDISKDIDYDPIAANLAAIVFPISPKSNNKFFEETPQTVLTAVLEVFIARANHKWTFRQLILVMQSQTLIELITNLEPQSRASMEHTFGASEKSLGDVMATINSKLGPWARIAASWETASKKISIRSWLQESSILLLPKLGVAKEETLRLYKLFIDIVATNVSRLPGGEDKRRTWFFLDEFTQLGRMSGLADIILLGRNKGFSCVLGTQQPGLVHEVYGKHDGEALISECGNKCLLKASSAASAGWCSDSINMFVDAWEHDEEDKRPVEAFPPRYFMALEEAGFKNGFDGVYLGRSVAGWTAHYSPAELQTLIPPPDKNIDTNIQVAANALRLKQWTKEDSELFGLPWPLKTTQEPAEQRANGSQNTAEPNAGDVKDDPLAGVNATTLD